MRFCARSSPTICRANSRSLSTAARHDCVAGAINDIGLRAVIRDGKRGFRMTVGGGLGPLPMEAQLLDEFLPEERLLNRCEAVIRVFNKYGNRQNKNKARMKFVLRERGFEWVREQIEKEYADILANGGIATPEMVPEGFGGFQSSPQPLGQGALLPVVNTNGTGDAGYDRWHKSNVREQRQPGYAMVTVRVDQGNLTGDQMRGVARIASDAGDGLVRVTIDQNLLLAFIPLGRLRRVYAALGELGLDGSGAGEIEDVTTCPGAYSCNLGAHQVHEPGRGVARAGAQLRRPAGPQAHHQDQRLPQFLRPALDRRFRLLRQRPQDRWQGDSVLPDAARRRIRPGRCHALRLGRAEHSGAPGARSREARARSFHRQPDRTARAFAST